MSSPNANPLPQHVTVEIMGLTPSLRDDLEISVQVYAGKTCYLIEDPVSSRFSRVGLAEYTLLSMLDGRTTIAEAIGQTAAILGPQALSEHEAAALCKWLIDSQLAETQQSRGAGRLMESADRSRRRTAARWNPIFQKVPLLNPDPLLRRVAPWSGLIFSLPAVFAWVVIVVWGTYCIGSRWDQFTSDSTPILAPDNWIWLGLTWLGLKLVHELGHALACQRFGGRVREAGVLFVLLAPLPYVDVTASWRFDSKWKRIFTSAAGMYCELAVAAIMAVLWSRCDDPLWQQHAQNVVIMATVVTVLFNLNPLMRFDGYYVLCDWLEMPNLATHGRQQLAYLGRRYFMGLTTERPDWPEGRTPLVAAYALAAMLWRIFVCTVLILAAEALFWGAGIVLAALAVVLWVVLPAFRLVRLITRPGAANRVRMMSITAAAAAMVVVASYLPCYWRVTAPAVVDYDAVHEVRIPVGGFVQQVLARAGDDVKAGQLLAVLENRELELEVERLRVEIEQSEQRARTFRHAREISALQVETENRKALQTRWEQLRHHLDQLEVRTPISGTVTHSDLRFREGTFVPQGERVFAIGGQGRKRIHALITQEDVAALNAHAGELPAVRVHIWGQGGFTARLEQIQPRVTTTLVHPALGAAAGGPLTVRRSGDEHASARWELVEPHVAVVASCLSAETAHLHPGETGVIQLRCHRGRLGEVVLDQINKWLRKRRDS